MRKYQEPEVTITKFQAEAILLTSGALTGDEGGFADGLEEDWK